MYTTYSTALKGITQDVIPKDKRPYMVSTNQPIDAMLGLTGLYARMTNSFVISGGINAVQLALEDRLREIYEKHNGKPKI